VPQNDAEAPLQSGVKGTCWTSRSPVLTFARINQERRALVFSTQARRSHAIYTTNSFFCLRASVSPPIVQKNPHATQMPEVPREERRNASKMGLASANDLRTLPRVPPPRTTCSQRCPRSSTEPQEARGRHRPRDPRGQSHFLGELGATRRASRAG